MRGSCWEPSVIASVFVHQDEPTNNLDMETIDSLARAINNWDGGMVRA